MPDLICIAHLRWDFVRQRPQHVLTRLGRRGYRIFYVEEPVTSTTVQSPKLEILTRPERGLRHDVCVIRLIQPASHDHWIGHGDPLTQVVYARLLNAFLAAENVKNPLLWLYTPMALDFTTAIDHEMLVYDVMDQLSAFAGAPPELLLQEKKALRMADLVFVGGASLYRDKLSLNPNTHLLPSGIEIEHFARAAKRRAFPKPPELAAITGPILGYFGVIDERTDLVLIASMARSHPEWQIVLLGPVVKIDPSELPTAPNLHYPGMKTYDELPAYLAHFDVALIPFVLTEATRYLSPTKTLEYMAAHKSIVSTPINDVIELYGSVVLVGRNHDEFIAQVGSVLAGAHDLNSRRHKEDELLALYTWDSIADRMARLIDIQKRTFLNSLPHATPHTPYRMPTHTGAGSVYVTSATEASPTGRLSE